jgi:hypothetical protein
MAASAADGISVPVLAAGILETEGCSMPGASGSGRKGLGAALLADALYEHLRRGADLLRARCPGGLGANEEEWVEQSHSLVMQKEIDAAKTALARSLLEGEDVTDACLKLAMHSYERYGPLLRLADAA